VSGNLLKAWSSVIAAQPRWVGLSCLLRPGWKYLRRVWQRDVAYRDSGH